jgi:Family of unknown function (DUF6505)
MRFPRTIRFDASDEQVFERAAEPDEWAVSGAFAFADADPDCLSGKRRQAFRSGFLGTRTFGWSTFAVVAEIGTDELDAVVDALARHLVAHYGAPSLEAASVAARAETEFAAGLCDPQDQHADRRGAGARAQGHRRALSNHRADRWKRACQDLDDRR